MKIITVIGLILTLVFTLPFLFIVIAVEWYRWKYERPDADPPSKDEWKIM